MLDPSLVVAQVCEFAGLSDYSSLIDYAMGTVISDTNNNQDKSQFSSLEHLKPHLEKAMGLLGYYW